MSFLVLHAVDDRSLEPTKNLTSTLRLAVSGLLERTKDSLYTDTDTGWEVLSQDKGGTDFSVLDVR